MVIKIPCDESIEITLHAYVTQFKFFTDTKEEFFVELSKLDFPALKNIIFCQTWHVKRQNRSRNLTDSTLQALVSKCPNLKIKFN